MSAAVRMTRAEVLDAIARERARLWSAVDRMGDAAGTTVVSGDWTTKDVLAHMIHWAGQIAAALGAPLHQPPWVDGVAGRLSGDEWNRRAAQHYRSASLDAVRRDLDTVVDALVARLGLRNDDQMNATDAIPWADAKPLWQQVGDETFLHWPGHTADVERAAALRPGVR